MTAGNSLQRLRIETYSFFFISWTKNVNMFFNTAVSLSVYSIDVFFEQCQHKDRK